MEAVRRGATSDGAQVFERLANGALGDRHATYLTFLGLLFDEFAVDLPVLFDRSSPSGACFRASGACCRSSTSSTTRSSRRSGARTRPSAGSTSTSTAADERRDDARRLAGPAKQPRAGRPQPVLHPALRRRLPHRQHARPHLDRDDTGSRRRSPRPCDYLVRTPTTRRPRAKKDPREISLLDPACGWGHFLALLVRPLRRRSTRRRGPTRSAGLRH